MTTATTHTDSTDHGAPSAAAATHPPIDVSGDRVPFIRLAGLEVRKMVDTRAGMWMLITMAAIGFLVSGILLIWGNEPGDTDFSTFLTLISMPLLILLPIMGILSATQEWSQRTGLATFTLVPRRGRVIAAKCVAALVLTLVLLAAGAVAAAAATLLGGGEFTMQGVSAGGLTVAALVFTLQGVAFGAVFLNTPIAIVASLVLPTIWTILTSMITRVQDIAPWLDLQMVTDPLIAGTMSGKDWGQLATASLTWVVLPLAIGTWRILTREVK